MGISCGWINQSSILIDLTHTNFCPIVTTRGLKPLHLIIVGVWIKGRKEAPDKFPAALVRDIHSFTPSFDVKGHVPSLDLPLNPL